MCAPLREHGGIAIEFASLGAVVRAADVTFDNELSHRVAVDPQGDVGQNLVEFLKLLTPILVRNNTSILAQAAKVKVLIDTRYNDEGGLARSRRELLEIS